MVALSNVRERQSRRVHRADETSGITLTGSRELECKASPASPFDAVAEDYDAAVEGSLPPFGSRIEFFHRNKVHHLVRAVRQANIDLSSARVLDIGCGTGAADHMLRPMVGSVAGVDVSTEMVAQARAVNSDVDHRVYDGENLPFGPQSFDVAFAFNVMHHVPRANWLDFAFKMITAVRPGGLCVIIEHNRLNPVTRRSVRNCPFDADAVLLRPSDVRRVFGCVGTDFVAKWYILFTPSGGTRTFRAEQLLSRLPFGGQYLYAVRRI
jgi:SAM-dependent methyltransferase